MIFKTLNTSDIKTSKTNLNQIVDFVEEDVSGSNTRKKYQVFVTSSGPSPNNSVTSSLFQTVFDQNYSLQTANELFDMTYGVFSGSASVASASTGIDSNGKVLFASQSLMMREKISNYRQYAQLLLGDGSKQFSAPFAGTSDSDLIDHALFINMKRIFSRDGIKRETFAMRFYQTSSAVQGGDSNDNIFGLTSINCASGSTLLTDVGAASNIQRSQFGGDVGNIVFASNTSRTAGLIFYQMGTLVLDLEKIIDTTQAMKGNLPSVGAVVTTPISASFVPHFVNSASIDTIVDHIATSRFGSGSNTCMTFQNNTQINSKLVFCRLTADEFNYSSNPTYTDSEGRIVVIDETQQGVQKSFSFITTIGLYDSNEELLAVAKLSRPVEKNDEKDLTLRVRLDF